MQTNEPETTAEKTGRATYSPEDNCLRLYVGRVPREEFLKLRREGWRTLHKQREAGGGDFAATWSPERVRTCLFYADMIEDEDMGPEERAADRAERFGGYRDKRTEEATGHADTYDAGPAVHGYQNQARAERAAARHDRQAGYAVDAWSKAEYWTRRTEGVIRHALYKSSPGVRMGRIKGLEALLRKELAEIEERKARWAKWCEIRDIADPAEQTKAALHFTGYSSGGGWYIYRHPRAAELPDGEHYKTNDTSLYSLLSEDKYPITGAEAVKLFFEQTGEPSEETEWTIHYTLRIAYETQMLKAQGGMLEQFEVLPGGKLGGRLIIKVSKSSVTKRATSCDVLGPKVSGWHYRTSNIPGTEFAAYKFDLERIKPDAYTPPTPESLAELKAFEDTVKAVKKAAADKRGPCPLVNPTDQDAERLQAVWNAQRLSEDEDAKPKEIERMTQAVYSRNSGGEYAACDTVVIMGGGRAQDRHWNAKNFPGVAKVRGHYGRVIILTDKPQKPLPAAVWEDPRTEAEAELIENLEELRAALRPIMWEQLTEEQRRLFDLATRCGWVSSSTVFDRRLTKQGIARTAKALARKEQAEQFTLV